MKKIILGIGISITAALIAACSQSEAAKEEWAKARIFKELDVYDTEALLVRTIKDSDIWYCGKFNAKNRFGGYVGWKTFLFTKKIIGVERFYYEGADNEDEIIEVLNPACARQECKNENLTIKMKRKEWLKQLIERRCTPDKA